MEIRLLGSLQVVTSEGSLTVTGQDGAVLAVLALEVPRTVAKDRLYEIVWGHRPSQNLKRVEDCILNLRRRIPDGRKAVITRAPGYALDIAADDVDVHQFREMINEGKRRLDAGDNASALDLLNRAKDLWRGEPLPELRGTGLEGEAQALEDLYLTAQEYLIEASLHLGQHHHRIGEIESLLRDNPLRERLWWLLMLALYRSGRQAEALASYQRAHRKLAEDLGIEPSPELRQLQSRILTQDPDLALPASKVTLAGALPETSNFEIQMYWGFRPAAHGDIQQAILASSSRITVSGMGLTTIADVLNDPTVLNHIAEQLNSNEDFEITIVTASGPSEVRRREEGGTLIAEKIRTGGSALRRFRSELERKVPSAIARLRFLTYDEHIIPRHFILQVDATIYVGSYLSHQQGNYSYLMKLINHGEGLYTLFADELTHILAHTQPLDPTDQGK
jgi:DNA-binding SARP family transcriptional activator